MSKVVLIGDYAVGKTSMVHALAKKPYERVEVKNALDGDVGQTESMENKSLQVICDLPAKSIDLSLVWIDTPGEVYINRQKHNTGVWQEICKEIQTSRYVILLLPLHQSLFNNKNSLEFDSDSFITSQNSKNRFREWWIPFLNQNCQNARHILICRHKADICNPSIENLANQNKYASNGFSWKDYFDSTKNYFGEIKDEIDLYKKQHQHQEVRLFVTTIYNRSLLELPWIYIGTREAIRPQY